MINAVNVNRNHNASITTRIIIINSINVNNDHKQIEYNE